ncbi:winged helix-turn-helix domain-containing protein [Streptomyces sp. NPDC016640]|uniref:winged helix-turn-helix domain-containing protein n=1 Tax=Streptomyces sp. NPDC016640 TaxID=3364969 RepID=UPI0036FCB9A5
MLLSRDQAVVPQSVLRVRHAMSPVSSISSVGVPMRSVAMAKNRRSISSWRSQVLDVVEQQAVRRAVLDHRPCDLGLAGQLWTRAGVGDLIAKLYRVRLTEQGVGKYLRRWGMSFQRPDKRAVEQNPEAVRVWREETWPAIHAQAKAEGAEVLFADQVGIRSDQVTGRTWGAKGCTPIVRRTGNQFSGRVQPVDATLLIREVCCGTSNRLDDGVDGSVTDEVAGTAVGSARTSGVQASKLCFPSAGSIMPGFRAATRTGSAQSGPCRERRSPTTAGSSTRTTAGTGRHSSTADAAAACTGSTVAVVNLHATTWQAEVSRSPRPRLWR